MSFLSEEHIKNTLFKEDEKNDEYMNNIKTTVFKLDIVGLNTLIQQMEAKISSLEKARASLNLNMNDNSDENIERIKLANVSYIPAVLTSQAVIDIAKKRLYEMSTK